MDERVTHTEGARFDADVLAASAKTPVLVDFWATWCAPCHALAPLLERLAIEYAGRLVIRKIDVDSNPDIAARYDVRALPTLKMFRHGAVVDELVGVHPAATLRVLVERHLEKPFEADLVAARAALERGDPATAVDRLKRALASDAGNPALMLELAAALLAAGETAQAEATLRELPANVSEEPVARALRARIEFARAVEGAPDEAALERRIAANPDDLESRYLLGARRAVAGDHEGALEQMLEIMRRDRAWRDDLGRRSIVAVFEIIGPDSELARTYRTKMSALLY